MNVGQTSIQAASVAATPASGAEPAPSQAASDPAPFLAVLLQAAVEPEEARDPGWVDPLLAPALPMQMPTPLEFDLPAPVVSAPPASGHTGRDLGGALKVALGLGVVEATGPAATTEPVEPPPPTTTFGFDATLAATRAGAPSPTSLGESVRTVQVPVGDRHWPDAVGHEVRLLVERGVSSATLRLSPEHLGPVEVRIEVVEDKANVWFGAANADTRAALADALPRLRDMLAASGMLLGDAGVHQDAPGGSRNPALQPPSASGQPESVEPEPAHVARIGLVDAYA